MLGKLHSCECLLACFLVLQCACTFAFLGENHCKEMACYADYNNAPKARWQGNYKNQRYVGTFPTVGQCETACVNYKDRRGNKCFSFAWFDAPETGCLARKDCLTGQCFAIIDDTWDPVEHKGAISGRIGLAASSVMNKAFVTVANLTDTLSGGISESYNAKEESARKAAEEAKKKATAEEAKKKAAAEEAKKKATAEEAKKKAAVEEAKKKAAEEAKKKAAAEEAARKAAAKKAEEAKRSKKSNKQQADSDSSWYAWTNTMSPEQIITPSIAAIVIASLIAYSMKDSKAAGETPADKKGESSSNKSTGNAKKQQSSSNAQKKGGQTKLGAAAPSKQSKESTTSQPSQPSQPFDFLTNNILLGSSAPPAAKEATTATTASSSSSSSAKPEQKKAESKTVSEKDFAAKRSFWQLKAQTSESPTASSPSKKSKAEADVKEGNEAAEEKSSSFLPNIDLFKLPLPNLIPDEDSAKYRKLEEDRRKKNAIDDEGAWLL
ncbi:hypothetical protein GUITHDRAFT_166036 [Guillardia theta CCMP2712]|uniref:Apple domain-containing protein n=2 Tax=Guillardia theta TaxID=55529 RepID=L1IHP3_GUITC|nr:hypothetical protein GUITHDRAFT_166036 [Guillardia theta CCMP2712]EKX35315.1 hypothetical protein GUITHDRAFT_166036 [Guillardia theta CCMP2712]|eukprot:XP_005822295.1 hypothetical protein GUITHDRAFT_166036 [Guillardia theta CCMP2712]